MIAAIATALLLVIPSLASAEWAWVLSGHPLVARKFWLLSLTTSVHSGARRAQATRRARALYKVGDPGERAYVIERGKVEVVMLEPFSEVTSLRPHADRDPHGQRGRRLSEWCARSHGIQSHGGTLDRFWTVPLSRRACRSSCSRMPTRDKNRTAVRPVRGTADAARRRW